MTGSTRSDGALVRLAKAGDAPAFDQLIERHAGLVYTIARARLRDPETAEDLMQEVFLRVHLHLHRLDDPDRIAPWIAALTRNLATDWLRRGQRRSQILPLVPLDESTHHLPDTRTEGARETMASEQQRQAVLAAIDQLPPSQREVILLHCVEEMKQVDIAQRLGVRPNRVHRLLRRAMASLREAVTPALSEAAPALRVPRQAVARTSALVGAAALLSGGAREALAAAAAATMPAVSAKSAEAGVLAAAVTARSTLLEFVHHAGALVASGGSVMGIGKGAAAVAVIAAGGYFGYNQFADSGSTAHTPVVTRETFTPAAASTGAAPGETVRIVNALPAGAAYRSDMRITLDQTITGPGLPAEGLHNEMVMEGNAGMRVIETLPGGSSRSEFTMSGMRFTRAQATAGGQTTDLLAHSAQDLQPAADQMNATRMIFTADATGQVTGMHAANGAAPTSDQFIQEIMARAFSGFPDREVRPGDTWHRRFEMDGAPGASVDVDSTLVSITDRGGRRVATVRREGQVLLTTPIPISGQPGMPPGMTMNLTRMEGTVSGTSEFWLDDTMPISDQIDADLTLLMSAGQMPAPQGPLDLTINLRQRQQVEMTHHPVASDEAASRVAAARP